MQVKEITVEFGVTQNIGNYSNVKPNVVIRAELSEGENPETALDQMLGQVKQQIHALVDDELEHVGMEVKYFSGQLYELWENRKRFCVVLAPANTPMPEEKNWKESDHWLHHADPRKMRLALAEKRFKELATRKAAGLDLAYDEKPEAGPKWVALDCTDGNLDRIPSLPDPGPEPLWHSKDLRQYLNDFLRIDKDEWETVAALPYVDRGYLKELYDKRSKLGLGYATSSAIVEFILANPEVPDPTPVPALIEDDYDDDYDEDEYDDDDD